MKTKKDTFIKETPSQTIGFICDMLNAFGLPENAVNIIRKKCWYLADSVPQGNGNGMDKTTPDTNKSS
jgi:hypothetical protein